MISLLYSAVKCELIRAIVYEKPFQILNIRTYSHTRAPHTLISEVHYIIVDEKSFHLLSVSITIASVLLGFSGCLFGNKCTMVNSSSDAYRFRMVIKWAFLLGSTANSMNNIWFFFFCFFPEQGRSERGKRGIGRIHTLKYSTIYIKLK